MSKRMMAGLAIGTLVMALAAAGCDDGFEPGPVDPGDTGETQGPPVTTGTPPDSSGPGIGDEGGGGTGITTPVDTVAPVTALGCKDLFDCYGACGQNDNACLDACWAKGSPEGQGLENAISSCANQNNCQDWACIEQACGSELQACNADTNSPGGGGVDPVVPPPGLGCKDLFDCYGGCGQNDSACLDACWAKGSPEGQSLENAISSCANQNNCQDWACIEQACGSELQTCAAHTGSDTTPELSCSGLFQCYDKCAQNDNACLDTCWSQGSPAGQQAENAIWSCAQQANCQDWQCVEQACGGELQACFG